MRYEKLLNDSSKFEGKVRSLQLNNLDFYSTYNISLSTLSLSNGNADYKRHSRAITATTSNYSKSFVIF